MVQGVIKEFGTSGLKLVQGTLSLCKPIRKGGNMITVEFQNHFDVTTKVTTKDVYLRLYLSAFKSGLVADLKPTNFTVLLAICSYMDEKGECYPTQRQIAERCGISKTTVNKAINELLEIKINDKPVIERRMIITDTSKNSVYTVNPVSQVAIFGGEVDTNVNTVEGTEPSTDTSTMFNTARDVSNLYLQVYKDVYGVNPNINYGRDLSMVKKKWIGNFTDEQIKTMVVTGVTEYDKRWKNSKFPRPSLSALVSWIGEQALGLADDSDKEFKENTALTSGSAELNDVALNRLANRLK